MGNQTSQIKAQNRSQTDNGFGQMVMDGVNHLSQGVSLGWSDELNGVIGGVGRVVANGIMRAAGYNVNGENFADAWNNGYQEYRDFARQELNDGQRRNPAISGLAEVGGALVSPIKPFKGRKGAVTNGVIGGIGMTDTNKPKEYGINIGLNTAGSVAGEKFAGILGDKANYVLKEKVKNLSFVLSKSARALTKMGANGFTNQLNNWRKGNE